MADGRNGHTQNRKIVAEKISSNDAIYCLVRTELNCSVMGICRSSLLNQKHYAGWFLLKRFVDLVRICYLHIIGRNHQKTKACAK